jgi:acyl carrier protein
MSLTREDIVLSATKYLKNKSDSVIEPETNLFNAGVLDSMEVMEMIHFLETEFKIEIEPEEIAEENFRTVAAIAALVEAKLR